MRGMLQGWLAVGVAALTACGTTSGGSGGVGGLPDVVSDLSLSFGGKDTTAKDTGAAKDTALGKDVAVDDAGALEDTTPLDDTGPDDTGLDDTGFFDEDIAVTDIKDTAAPKDTVSKDTTTADIAKDTGTKDTGSKDTATVDTSGTCGNGSCDSGETCETCAVDCTCKPCNPLTSTGCTASQQCYVTTNGLQCGGFGKVADGGSCQYLNDCAKGSMCVGSICRKVCATVSGVPGLDCSAPATCEELASGSTPLGYNLGACFAPDNCNLVTSSGCPSGLACMPTATGKQCTPAGKVGLDGACTSVADCAIGFLCLNNGQPTGTCKQRCDTTVPGTCPSGTTCGTITIGNPPVLVGENFGVCDKP